MRQRPPADVLLGPGSAGRHQARAQKKTPNPAAQPRYSRICQLPGSGAAPPPYSSRADGGSSPRSWPKPPARAGRAGGAQDSKALTTEQCREHLAGGGVGRFLFVEPRRGPVAIPVNHLTDGDDIVFRTSGQTSIADAVGQQQVSFDVDHLDDTLSEGWSVLLSGTARIITDLAELEHATALGIEPWAQAIGISMSACQSATSPDGGSASIASDAGAIPTRGAVMRLSLRG